MREKMLASRIPVLVLLLLLFSLLLPFSSTLRSAAAAPAPGTTAISPSGGTGSPAGLGTVITAGTSTLPTNLCTANCVITGGTRAGSNLFHSFGDFSVGTLDGARFQTGLVNPVPDASVANILGRVTGGNPSNIFGNINSATYYPSANLFLMNPTGFLFGPNATVNVGGMVAFTTADYLRLRELDGSNAGIFHADPAQTSVLTSAPVAAFGFIGSNPAAINFEGGQLTVAEGTGLTLVGGNISLVPDASETPSSITAHGRPILLTSVAGPGEVAAASGVPAGGMVLGTITLEGAILDTSGDPSFGDGSGSGGPISIRGGQLVATGATITTSRAAGTLGPGGAVTVDVTGSATFTDSTIQTSTAFDFSFVGSGGAVSITANEGVAMTRTTIDTNAFVSSGDGGSVTLKSLNGPVSLTDSIISTIASAPGNGGEVTVTGKDVSLTRSGIFTDVDTGIFDLSIDDPALGLVHPGAVTITAQNAVTFSGSPFDDPFTPVISARATGTLLDAGSVTITGKTVNLTGSPHESLGLRLPGINVSMNAGQTSSPGNGGTIEIRGNDINLSEFSLNSENAGNRTSTGTGGSILLRGADNQLADKIQLTNLQIVVASVTGGGAGSIEFQTSSLTLNDAVVSANTAGVGPGGSVVVHGAQTVALQSNSEIDVSAVTSGIGTEGPFGAAGTILLETQQLTMHGGSALRAADLPLSQGNAGSIRVQGTNAPAQSILIDGNGTGIFTDAEGNGAGGNINLFANSLTLQNGGTLSAITSGTVPTATGGTITVNANTVTLTTGGSMTAASTGAGASGEVIVQGLASPAQSILIDGSGSSIFTNTSGTGAGGDIHLSANSVTLQNGAHVSSSSTGTGVAGDITINAGNQFAMANSSLTTEALHSSGGAIKITTNPNATVQLTTSTISASVLDGTGGGGSVNIDPQFVILQNSQILADAVFGPGGNINITTNLLLPDSTSVIRASSQFGQQGTIIIQSPISPASGKIVPLGQKPLAPTSLLSQRCAALAGGNISSFTVAGRDSLPAEPGGLLSSPLSLSMAESGDGTIQEADGMMRDEAPLLSLRKIAPPGFLTQAFAVDSSGCQS